MTPLPSFRTTLSDLSRQIDRVRFYRSLSHRSDIQTLPAPARRTLGLAE